MQFSKQIIKKRPTQYYWLSMLLLLACINISAATINLTAPILTATVNDLKVTLDWSNVESASAILFD